MPFYKDRCSRPLVPAVPRPMSFIEKIMRENYFFKLNTTEL